MELLIQKIMLEEILQLMSFETKIRYGILENNMTISESFYRRGLAMKEYKDKDSLLAYKLADDLFCQAWATDSKQGFKYLYQIFLCRLYISHERNYGEILTFLRNFMKDSDWDEISDNLVVLLSNIDAPDMVDLVNKFIINEKLSDELAFGFANGYLTESELLTLMGMKTELIEELSKVKNYAIEYSIMCHPNTKESALGLVVYGAEFTLWFKIEIDSDIEVIAMEDYQGIAFGDKMSLKKFVHELNSMLLI